MRSAGFRSTSLSTYTDVYFIYLISFLLLNPALRMSLCWGYVLSSFGLFVSALAKDILIDKFWFVRWVFRATWQCVWLLAKA